MAGGRLGPCRRTHNAPPRSAFDSFAGRTVGIRPWIGNGRLDPDLIAEVSGQAGFLSDRTWPLELDGARSAEMPARVMIGRWANSRSPGPGSRHDLDDGDRTDARRDDRLVPGGAGDPGRS